MERGYEKARCAEWSLRDLRNLTSRKVQFFSVIISLVLTVVFVLLGGYSGTLLIASIISGLLAFSLSFVSWKYLNYWANSLPMFAALMVMFTQISSQEAENLVVNGGFYIAQSIFSYVLLAAFFQKTLLEVMLRIEKTANKADQHRGVGWN